MTDWKYNVCPQSYDEWLCIRTEIENTQRDRSRRGRLKTVVSRKSIKPKCIVCRRRWCESGLNGARDVIYGCARWQTDDDVSLTFRISSTPALSAAATFVTRHISIHVDTRRVNRHTVNRRCRKSCRPEPSTPSGPLVKGRDKRKKRERKWKGEKEEVYGETCSNDSMGTDAAGCRSMWVSLSVSAAVNKSRYTASNVSRQINLAWLLS